MAGFDEDGNPLPAQWEDWKPYVQRLRRMMRVPEGGRFWVEEAMALLDKTADAYERERWLL